MLFTSQTAAKGLAFLLLFSTASAAPQVVVNEFVRRDDAAPSAAASVGTAPRATLQPVVPAQVDPDAFDVLALDQTVTLAWASSGSQQGSAPGSKQRLKRDGAMMTEAQFKFKHPTVPLDHSTFVTGVSCSQGTLKATVSGSAYAFAKKEWSRAKNIIFITSVDGCGDADANHLFHATSIKFSDSTKTFTATGSATDYRDSAEYLSLKWGDIGTTNLRRAIDKRAMFESHSLEAHLSGRIDKTFSWNYWLDDPSHLGTDANAPWPKAAPLASWGTQGGEPDDSYTKGQVASTDGGHHKRNSYLHNETDLAERDLEYGLKLYCVECGFGGSATIWGQFEASIWTLSIDTVQVGFNANFKAALNIGAEAFVKYEKEWQNEFAKFFFAGFSIPLLVTVGPYISVGVEAKAAIQATGTLLIGASVEWDNIDIMVDLLHSQNSHAKGLIPSFTKTAEAHGELKMHASLGLPISLGVGIEVLKGLWTADAAVVDTPSVYRGQF